MFKLSLDSLDPTAAVTRTASALLLAVCLTAAGTSAAGELVLQKGDRVAIVGDSITEQKQYSKFMELYLLASVPQLELTVCQFGWSGERAPGFADRMDNDLVPWRPTVVTTCYGMNDGAYRPYSEEIGATYEEGVRRIQSRCKALGARMIVGGPGPVDTDTWRANDPEADTYYNDNLARLSEIAARVAAENGFVAARLHPLMLGVMQTAKAALGPAYHVCGPDGVHPSADGHLVMAYAFLKAMGLDGAIGNITVDHGSGEATATDGHRILAAGDGKIEIESSRYPFCFFGDDKSPNSTASILPFLPFNRDLNRFILVVRNLSTPAAEIKWGEESKRFTKVELSAGINLAEAFPTNPFSGPFQALERVVQDKQNQETRTIKGVVTNFRWLLSVFPDDQEVAEATALLRRKSFERLDQDAARARAAVTPVTHTIVITPHAQ